LEKDQIISNWHDILNEPENYSQCLHIGIVSLRLQTNSYLVTLVSISATT